MRASTPADFAIVMATGILSVAAAQLGIGWLSAVLGVLAGLLYVAIAGLHTANALDRRSRMREHARSPSATFGFLTLVAATGVLAARLAQLGAGEFVAVLGVAAVLQVAWIVPRVTATFHSLKPRARIAYASGSWLLATVALQSLASIAADAGRLLSAGFLLYAGLACWLGGLALYGVVTRLIVQRAVSAWRGAPGWDQLLAGDHWILMGALAISSLAAASIAAAARHAHGFIVDPSVLDYCALALWLAGAPVIVVLIAAEAWHRRHDADAFSYKVQRWATVFPLGMFAASGHAAAAPLRVGVITAAATASFWIALAAWGFVARGLQRRIKGYLQGRWSDEHDHAPLSDRPHPRSGSQPRISAEQGRAGRREPLRGGRSGRVGTRQLPPSDAV